MSTNAMEVHAERPKLKRKYVLLNFTQGQIYGLFFCRRWIAKQRKPHWWMPQGMRYTIRALDMHEDSVEHNKEKLALKGRWFGPFVIGSAIVILLLAAYGYYIIVYIAS